MGEDWYTLMIRVPGIHKRTRTLLDHMANRPESERAESTGCYIVPGARFMLTSDKFALVDFVTAHGERKSGAFWGSWPEIVAKIDSLSAHMGAHGEAIGWTRDHSRAMVAALVSTVSAT
jgi:hypothetical protein